MTITTPRVRLAPPPPALMRMVNPFARRIIADPRLGRRFPLQAVLTCTGRRSGRTLRIPICLHTIDGVPIVFTPRRWRLNFTAPAAVTVTGQGRVRTGRAVLLHSTSQEVGAALRQALDHGATPFELGLKVDRGYDPTAGELSDIALHLIRIDFDRE